MSLLGKANRRFFYRHPRHIVLALAGIALGVAMFTAVDLSVTSSRLAFKLSMEAIVGKVTNQIVANTGDLDEALYTTLRLKHGYRDIAPVIEDYAIYRDQTVRILGIDPLASQALDRHFEKSSTNALTPLLSEPDTALIARATADRFGLYVGERVPLESAGVRQDLKIIGLLEGNGVADPALEGLIIVDIATAQEWLHRLGRLDRIDVILPNSPDAEPRLRSILPPDAVLRNAEGHSADTLGMLDAFTTNLRAMSALALLVGMFLIYNTLSFNLLQRRPLLANLRVLGATRGELLLEIVLEAAVLGLLGAVAGVMVGWLAAQWLLHLVTRTINDVYFVLTINQLLIEPAALARGVAVGGAATVIAALPPALEAVWSRPAMAQHRSLLETRTRRLFPRLAGSGLVLAMISFGLLIRPETDLSIAIGAVTGLALGYCLVVPSLVGIIASGSVRGGGRWMALLPRMALRGIGGTLSRTGVAAAALTLSVAMSIGTDAMIHSFRLAVAQWLDRLIQADIYIALPSGSGQSSQALAPSLVAAARALPGVARISTGFRSVVQTSLGDSELVALDPAYPERNPFRFKGGNDPIAWQDFLRADQLIVSEPYASRHHLVSGDVVILQTPQGPVGMTVGSIVFDYRSDRGVIFIHRQLFDRLWQSDAVSSIGLYLEPGANLDRVKAEANELAGQGGIVVHGSREIRDRSLVVFDRTFTVTRVLRLLVAGVAFIGIFSALLALQAERSRELATLRAIGFTPGQIRLLVMLQSGLLGLIAGALALPLGGLVGYVLVEVINLRSFGWSMDLILPGSVFFEALVLAALAGLLAGIYPAMSAARVAPAAALREE